MRRVEHTLGHGVRDPVGRTDSSSRKERGVDLDESDRGGFDSILSGLNLVEMLRNVEDNSLRL